MSRKSGKRRPQQSRRPAPSRPQRPGHRRVPAPAQQPPRQPASNPGLILLAGFCAALLLFWYYHLLVLNQLTGLSAGLAMPDQLIGGFDAAHVQALRAAMDADAAGQLNYVHKTAGVLFTLFLASATLLAVALHVRRRVLRWVLFAVPLGFAVVRLWGQAAIDALLHPEAAGSPVDAGDVALASALTVAGWVLLFGTVALAAAVVLASLARSFRRKHTEAGID
ncbi:hypothetical protein NCCP1664_24160 [Zafaria cholistanensis]|uniref:Uncharacterized protein n=1 Tax=Zafaria cholistanensis TaxID=1682741 RepID=A0A5A7NV77_9MICC|nr:hypothetical protein [Zafaria cholistanensis]GER23921.1 hypothetical protein NCCP1664_24160 [Zafaria cholistanensis]